MSDLEEVSKLVRENNILARENQKILRTLRRRSFFASYGKVLFILLILGIFYLFYLYSKIDVSSISKVIDSVDEFNSLPDSVKNGILENIQSSFVDV